MLKLLSRKNKSEANFKPQDLDVLLAKIWLIIQLSMAG